MLLTVMCMCVREQMLKATDKKEKEEEQLLKDMNSSSDSDMSADKDLYM